MPRVSRCRKCKAPIYWVFLQSGKKAPVDRDPVANGNVLLVESPSGNLKGRVLKDSEVAPEGRSLYISHFATCTDPAHFRRDQ